VDDVTPIPEQPCPHCGRHIDSTGPADRGPARPPRTGDFVVCFGCTEVLVWQVGPFGPVLRKPAPNELAEFNAHHRHHQDKVRLFHLLHEGFAP
jgi:hypothetical protein